MRTQTKSPVQLREKKLKDGSKSLYLDIYQNGRRSYKFLKMYLSPGSDKVTQAKNKATLLAARKIAADELIKLTNDKAGVQTTDNRTTLIEWMRYYQERKRKTGQSEERAAVIGKVIRILEPTCGNIKLSEVNERTLEGILDTLRSGGWKTNTVKTYYSCVVAALNQAVREKKIPRNPNELLDVDTKPKEERTKREYLTREELAAFAAVKLKGHGKDKGTEVQKAFVFSARFCGLRCSDLTALKWSDIDGGILRMRMQKTNELVSIPLGKQAMEFLGTNDSEYVFPLLQDMYRGLTYHYVKQIAKQAGITKAISMHTSRHTFAVLLLTAGVDIYTVSRLLGHSSIQATQIYADILDLKRKDAIEMLQDYLDGEKK